MLVVSTRASAVWPPSARASQVDDVGIGRVDGQDQVVIALGGELACPVMG